MEAVGLTKVMVVDDHSMVRELIRDALHLTGEYEVVAEAGDGVEALQLLESVEPDVVVMDVIMPVMDGVEACREITDRLPGTRVLMLTASNEQDAILRSIAAGATGFLQKYANTDELLSTLREVALGEFRIPGDAARRLVIAMRSLPDDTGPGRLEALTDRERGILKLYAQGRSYREIGDIRNNSFLTVRNTVSSVQRKLGFTTRQQLVVWAVRAGLLEDDVG